MRNIEIQIVNRIAELRKSQNLTVTQLAEKSNLSPSLISRIENYKISPPLSTLAQIADALKVNVSDFLKGEEESLSVMIHKKNEKYETIEKYGKKFLIPFFDNAYRLMSPIIFIVPPDLKEIHTMNHEGEEYMFILKGSLNFMYGRDEYVLNQEDSIYFKGHVPHGTYNLSNSPAEVLSIMTSRQNLHTGITSYSFLRDHLDENERPVHSKKKT